MHFYPRPPRGGRLAILYRNPLHPVFLSTPSARRATCTVARSYSADNQFLSTPSARRATLVYIRDGRNHQISIHALREEGDPPTCVYLRSHNISIHALREEGDPTASRCYLNADNFYPRPPRGGRPWRQAARRFHKIISIHALREEGDSGVQLLREPHRNFYPRPPRGGRHKQVGGRLASCTFLSTPSARRATRTT